MAKSSTYFWLRRGSTKSHTFSVVDGKQITKDRVEGCKNPRTLAQMSQRCMVATVGVAYSAMKCICDHSFEDLTAGMQCMRNFMHENLKQIRISKEYGNGFFGFCKFQESGLVPGSYGFGACASLTKVVLRCWSRSLWPSLATSQEPLRRSRQTR